MRVQPLSRSVRGLSGEMNRAEIGTGPFLMGQLVEQRLGVLQVRSVEALGEPVVDCGKHRARLVAAIGITQQARKAHRSAQLPGSRVLLTRNVDGFAVALLR